MSSHNFKRVIAQSGSALAGWAFDLEPEFHAKQIATRVGCPTQNLDEMVKCMKTMPAEEVVDAHTAYINDERYQGRMGFGGSSPCEQKMAKKFSSTNIPKRFYKMEILNPNPLYLGPTNMKDLMF